MGKHIMVAVLALFAAWTALAEPVTVTPAEGGIPPFAGVPGLPLDAGAAAAFEGGDVILDLDASRTRLTVTVYDNDSELRRKRQAPKENYTVDAHNRVAATTQAAFMPVGASVKQYAGTQGLTTAPAQFPAGTARITGVKVRTDKFGPNMISTNAVGTVDVYRGAEKVGTATDGGYAIHSNTNDFTKSVSWGCVVVKAADNERIAATLRKDAAELGDTGIPRQFITVWKR